MNRTEKIVSAPPNITWHTTKRGTRISVELILELFIAGWSSKMILERYFTLNIEDIYAVFSYLKDCVQNEFFFPNRKSARRNIGLQCNKNKKGASSPATITSIDIQHFYIRNFTSQFYQEHRKRLSGLRCDRKSRQSSSVLETASKIYRSAATLVIYCFCQCKHRTLLLI